MQHQVLHIVHHKMIGIASSVKISMMPFCEVWIVPPLWCSHDYDTFSNEIYWCQRVCWIAFVIMFHLGDLVYFAEFWKNHTSCVLCLTSPNCFHLVFTLLIWNDIWLWHKISRSKGVCSIGVDKFGCVLESLQLLTTENIHAWGVKFHYVVYLVLVYS